MSAPGAKPDKVARSQSPRTPTNAESSIFFLVRSLRVDLGPVVWAGRRHVPYLLYYTCIHIIHVYIYIFLLIYLLSLSFCVRLLAFFLLGILFLFLLLCCYVFNVC